MGIVVTTIVLVLLAALGAGIVLRRDAGPSAAAPRLSAGFAPTLLARAGFPATAHNVAVLHDHLAAAFLDAAHGAVPAEVLSEVGARCAAARGRASVTGGSSRSWPQEILDELAALGTPDVARFPLRAQEELLATAGTGRGLLGGSVFVPLPVATPVALPVPRRGVDVERPLVA